MVAPSGTSSFAWGAGSDSVAGRVVVVVPTCLPRVAAVLPVSVEPEYLTVNVPEGLVVVAVVGPVFFCAVSLVVEVDAEDAFLLDAPSPPAFSTKHSLSVCRLYCTSGSWPLCRQSFSLCPWRLNLDRCTDLYAPEISRINTGPLIRTTAAKSLDSFSQQGSTCTPF